MNALADETGGDVSMGIRDRLHIVLVETSRSRTRVRASGALADTGLSLPIAGSAIGRAWLAGVDGATRDAVLNEIRVKTPEDWARYEAAIEQALQDVTAHGFCAVDGDLVTQIQAVGVPYGLSAQGEFLVFNCAFARPPAGTKVHWLREDVGPRLLAMVQQLKEQR
jgi:DNA-binding IclR family transcriptional regulator